MEKKPIYNIKHRSYYFAKDVVLYIKDQKYDSIFFSMFDQLIRSATSVGANLVKGIAGVSKKDFLNFNGIALKSANETKYWLCLIKDTVDVEQTSLNDFIKEADEISKIIATIILKTKGNNS